MDEATFAAWSMKIGLTVLIIFLGFIIWDLGKKSQAGKFGMFILFLVFVLGIFGFIFKNILVEFLMPK